MRWYESIDRENPPSLSADTFQWKAPPQPCVIVVARHATADTSAHCPPNHKTRDCQPYKNRMEGDVSGECGQALVLGFNNSIYASPVCIRTSLK